MKFGEALVRSPGCWLRRSAELIVRQLCRVGKPCSAWQACLFLVVLAASSGLFADRAAAHGVHGPGVLAAVPDDAATQTAAADPAQISVKDCATACCSMAACVFTIAAEPQLHFAARLALLRLGMDSPGEIDPGGEEPLQRPPRAFA